MGCHTWFYANRKPLPENFLELVKARKDNEIAKWERLCEIHKNRDEQKILSLLQRYNEFIELIDDQYPAKYPKCEVRSTQFDVMDERFEDELGPDLFNYIKWLKWQFGFKPGNESVFEKFEVYMLETEEDRKGFTEEELLDAYVYETIKEYANTSSLIGYNLEELYYATEVEFHDNFRVYGYPEDVYYTRESLECFLFDKTVNNVMVAWNKDTNEEVDKSKDYKKFVETIKKTLDPIYEKYPDLIVNFG